MDQTHTHSWFKPVFVDRFHLITYDLQLITALHGSGP
jgi:hypothetical protein